jgi:ribosomal peptide maturation radical SAM protein 1
MKAMKTVKTRKVKSGKKVLLLSLPYGALERPALGLSLLKAKLAETGFSCDVRYLNFAFAEFIGHEEYQWMSYELPYTAFAGDWTFTSSLYGARPASENEYVEEVLRKTWRLNSADIARIQHIRSRTDYFLEHCLAAVRWNDYAIVGFTSTFEQNIASLALAKRIKAAHPEIKIVFGGANWEASMGLELHRQFAFVDYVCSGEAEESFPALVKRLLTGQPIEQPEPVPGIVYRASNGESVYTGQADLIREMDALPIPDFSDYFAGLEQCTVAAGVIPTLLFETSRGCWWGAKSHCTFCGLNGGTMAFRSKSPRRALDELEYLADRWQTDMVEAVDNILDMKYFNDMLPALARSRRSLQLFYEVKANLSRQQIRLLRDAGVYRIQPGIESMSDHILKLMRKGTTALRNIQLLKWCAEDNITAEWNILYGFPGETAEDYERMLELLPAIRHLRPPTACGPVRLDRFSPYYNAPAEFGLKNVRPMAAYKYLYPFDAESLQRIAYYFDYDYEAGVDPTGYAAQVIEYANEWRRDTETGTLYSVRRPDGTIALIDTRAGTLLPQLLLSGLEQAAYDYCDEIRSARSIGQHLRWMFPETEFNDNQVREFLDSLVANQLMATDGENYLSLAVQARPLQPSETRNTYPHTEESLQKAASSFLRAELKVLQPSA